MAGSLAANPTLTDSWVWFPQSQSLCHALYSVQYRVLLRVCIVPDVTP